MAQPRACRHAPILCALYNDTKPPDTDSPQEALEQTKRTWHLLRVVSLAEMASDIVDEVGDKNGCRLQAPGMRSMVRRLRSGSSIKHRDGTVPVPFSQWRNTYRSVSRDRVWACFLIDPNHKSMRKKLRLRRQTVSVNSGTCVVHASRYDRYGVTSVPAADDRCENVSCKTHMESSG